MFIISTKYDGLESQMLHTKFCLNRPAGSGEDFFSGFYHSLAWWPSSGLDPNLAIKLSFSLTMDAPHKISL